jgi:hypothetical protein
MKENFAPWSLKEVENLKKRQKRSDLHPYTCGSCASDGPMEVLRGGLKCKNCGRVQKWVWDEDLK